MRAALYIVLLISSVPAAFAQNFQHTLRNYKAVDGLPQSQVTGLLEDKNGYLWVGTEGGGLARYDGRQFKVFTTLDGLQSNVVHHLMFDRHHNLWATHQRGLSKFNGRTFKTFQRPSGSSSSTYVRASYEFNDSIFFILTTGTIGKIYNDSLYYWDKPILENSNIAIVGGHQINPHTLLFFLSNNTCLLRLKHGDFIINNSEFFNRPFGKFIFKNRLIVDTDSGYFSLNLSKKTFEKTTITSKNRVITYDSVNDTFWTRRGGTILREYHQDSEYKIDTVMRDASVNHILVDSEGNTWIGSNGSGLYKYFIQDFDRCSSENLTMVFSIHIDRHGASWLGSSTKGLWKLHKGKTKSYFNANQPYRSAVIALAESPKGELWIGTRHGLGKYIPDKDQFQYFTREDGLSHDIITGIQFDENNQMYIATYSGGVNIFDGKSFQVIKDTDGLNSNFVKTLMYSPRMKKLFVGNDLGINVIDGTSVSKVDISGLENTSILTMSEYRDSLIVIGTGGSGIVFYNPQSTYTKYLTTKEGLASDFIYFVAPDDDGYLWIGTEKGITRIKNDRHLDIKENLHYDNDNGLHGVETNMNGFYIKGDKKYFALIDGVYQYNDLKQENRRSFDLHLTDIEVTYGQYSPYHYSDSTVGLSKLPYNPSFPPDKNHITFHFNRVDKRYPKSVKFKYFLEGFDQTWSLPSSANEVTYSNLPPGNYIFRVMSTNNRGAWADVKVAYPFSINAPFYKTASFIVGSFLLLAGVITLVLYLRVKQRVNRVMMLERIRVKEQESLRKEIARDFHDEMGNQLSRIINYISLLKLNGKVSADKDSEENDLYTKVEDSAKYLYTGTRDFIWSIDPGNDELSKLFIHIRDFGEKLFEEKNISFRAFNEIREKVKLPYGFSREANLIFKEVMTNAFKYSQASNVTFTLKRDELNGYAMSFEDDGIGFNADQIEKSSGLKNIRERADKIFATLRIHSVQHAGTKITLNFTLTKTLKYGLAL